MKTLSTFALAAAALSAPAAVLAHPIIVERDRGMPIAPNNDSNKWWLDYKTDISEAKRELRSDLRRATDEEDRRDAHEEYRNEIADAKHDYRKEMRERGYRVANFRENRRLARR
ncbi:hypothetical protein [Erythrobacter sp. F6033]|uniref:hypothetical protein n=1 Tax=Erythrobacter sp. F6033 TaxID=2926401 RepID=UPI001FF3C323|nr:hypothetical protein [Erythrobacter sp. F6033]MCK0127711.1 hypothetical protein [Erythrobacter sp. F6033]